MAPLDVGETLAGQLPHIEAKLTVVFRLQEAKTQWGELLCVAGEASELGSWAPEEAVGLETDVVSFPQWHSDEVRLTLPSVAANRVVLRYKYVLDRRKIGKGFFWEDGIPDREVSIPLPACASGDEACHWLVIDSAFNAGSPPQLSRLTPKAVKAPCMIPKPLRSMQREEAIGPTAAAVLANVAAAAVPPEWTPEPASPALSDVETFEEKYSLIGEAPYACGGFSTVWRCCARGQPECFGPEPCGEFAVKRLERTKLSARARRLLFGKGTADGEIALHLSLMHPRIVELIEVFEEPKTVSMVMEFCEGGDLLEIVLSHRCMHCRGLPEAAVANAGRQLFEALAFLHGQGIIHRDVKCENLFQVEARGSVPMEKASFKLGDFGLAARLLPEEVLLEPVGSPSTSAPEVVRGRPYAAPADIWSAGALLFTALAAERPCCDAAGAAASVQGKVVLEGGVWDTTSASAKRLLRSLLGTDVLRRPTAKAALCDEWLRAR